MNGVVAGETNGSKELSHSSSVASLPAESAAAASLKDPPGGTATNETNSHDNNSTSKDASSSITEQVGPFRALQQEGKVLDVYAYHRGREGRELRDETTGELLCGDVEATDTNHHSGDKEPKTLTTTVTIKFPLEDEAAVSDSEPSQRSGSPQKLDGKAGGRPIRYYKEAIQWNLADPETPNPMVFAAGIGQDFGLSYAQMLDLAESIQKQLAAFVAEQCTYAPALVLRPQQEKPVARAPHLYFDVTGTGQLGGTYHAPVAPKLKPAPPTVQRAGSFSSVGRASVAGSTKSEKKRRRSSDSIRKVEDVFLQQIRNRLREASIREVQARAATASNAENQEADDVSRSSFESLQPNELKLIENHVCHHCQQEQEVCGVFGCGDSGHAYCFNHLGEQLGLVDTSQLELDYCPICSLLCDCVDCSTRLEVAAVELKKRCADQAATPETTVFDDLQEFIKKIDVEALVNEKKEKEKAASSDTKKQKTSILGRRPIVPKLPISEFPREVSNGVDMDFGNVVDYQTRFTEKGSYRVSPEEQQDKQGDHDVPMVEGVAVAAAAAEEPVEDGSVDFCNVCRKVGNLLCCDFCPRAFHSKCIPPSSKEQESAEVEKWECPSCRREKGGLEDDAVSATPSLQRICEAYPCPMTTKEDLRGLRVLSMLREMLNKLMNYDFGYMFRSPVDCKAIPTYTTIVKKPMDLGTISTNMLNGHYRKELGDHFSFENVALAVLKDIELVWHDCFIFNLEGSAVYRMAEVQRRRALSIQQRSIQDLLSERVKEEQEKYTVELKKEREEFRRLEQPVAQRRSSLNTSTQARHKIAGPVQGGSKCRPIAVLDPDTGMIVKIYTSIASASKAINFLFNLKKHRCEFPHKDVQTNDKLRRVSDDCRQHPGVRLFGYRWLFLDDLRNQNVVFPDSEDGLPKTIRTMLIQMADGDLSYFFNSVEEALSFPGLPTEAPEIRDRLQSLVPGSDYIEIAGRLWRSFDGKSVQRTSTDDVVQPASKPASSDNVSQLSDVAFEKVDLLYGERNLLGFQTAEAAFEDWRQTIAASIFPYQGPRTMKIFLSFYLYGDRNVDGIRWRSVTRDSKLEEMKTTTGDEKVTEHPFANGAHGVEEKMTASVSQEEEEHLEQKIAASAGLEQEENAASSATTGLEWEEIAAFGGLQQEQTAAVACLKQQESASLAEPTSDDTPSSKVFDLEKHSVPESAASENVKPAAKPGGGILNGLVRHFSPLVRMRASSKDEAPDKDSSFIFSL